MGVTLQGETALKRESERESQAKLDKFKKEQVGIGMQRVWNR